MTPSPPAAPRLALTRLYASHTSRLAMSNDFASTTRVIPLQVVREAKLNDDAPSVQSHYGTFNPTTSVSAPVPRISTLALADAVRLGFSLRIGTTGSYVPYQSLDQDHAAFMPEASWAVDRFAPNLARGTEVQVPVSTSVNTFRHVISGLLAFVFSILT